jgi:hypothetical protein
VAGEVRKATRDVDDAALVGDLFHLPSDDLPLCFVLRGLENL